MESMTELKEERDQRGPDAVLIVRQRRRQRHLREPSVQRAEAARQVSV
jgi:hypothetical protein